VNWRRFSFGALILISLLVSACSAVRVEEEREIRATPATPPAAVYVKDFDLRSGDFHAETGILPLAPLTINGPAALIPRVLGVPEDNTIRACELVNLMSSAIVADLRNDGLNATYLAPGQTVPTQGWMVHGTFVQVDEGNRLRRALVGFGSGETKLRVLVWVSDLSNRSPDPFYLLDSSSHSSRKPGAAFTFDPYVAAARFLTDGLDMETNVTQIAAEISDDISERSRTGEPPKHW
jgi:Domain of unknown function (DUF4410)